MVHCLGCCETFHYFCVHLPERLATKLTSWFCHRCAMCAICTGKQVEGKRFVADIIETCFRCQGQYHVHCGRRNNFNLIHRDSAKEMKVFGCCFSHPCMFSSISKSNFCQIFIKEFEKNLKKNQNFWRDQFEGGGAFRDISATLRGCFVSVHFHSFFLFRFAINVSSVPAAKTATVTSHQKKSFGSAGKCPRRHWAAAWSAATARNGTCAESALRPKRRPNCAKWSAKCAVTFIMSIVSVITVGLVSSLFVVQPINQLIDQGIFCSIINQSINEDTLRGIIDQSINAFFRVKSINQSIDPIHFLQSVNRLT